MRICATSTDMKSATTDRHVMIGVFPRKTYSGQICPLFFRALSEAFGSLPTRFNKLSLGFVRRYSKSLHPNGSAFWPACLLT
jgi:hypothetical protein